MQSAAAPPLHPLIRYLRDHRGARVALSVLSGMLLLAAVGMLGYPFYTNLFQSWKQGQLDREIGSDDFAERYRAFVKDRTSGKIRDGDSLTRIKIPSIDVDVIVVEGTSPSALRAGAGHYPSTSLPCEIGNVAIAGHRTTYGKPFANMDRLRPGDEITLETPVGSCTYKALAAPRGRQPLEKGGAPFIVGPTDQTVVAQTPGRHVLTLTSCHPKGSAAKRIILQAEMVKS